MSFETIFYAIIAVALLARLWSVLGRRNDSDQERPNPFITPAPGLKDDQKTAQEVGSSSLDINAAPYPALPRPQAAPASLAGGLEQIKGLDTSFDEKTFLIGARSAFTMIVEDFAKGDMNRIERLLGPKVLPHFQNAIEARRNAGQIMEGRVVRIRDADAAAARVDGTLASITVRFISEQEHTLRDRSGQIVGGADGHVEEITDLWTFTRDTASDDPNWILAETHS